MQRLMHSSQIRTFAMSLGLETSITASSCCFVIFEFYKDEGRADEG
jgi:hypothetical protein